MRKYRRERRLRDPEYKSWRLKDATKYQTSLRLKVILFLGGKCFTCGFSDIRALQIDHIEGGGTKLNKTISWSKRYLEILAGKNTVKVQILCANCNWIKRWENKELGRVTIT